MNVLAEFREKFRVAELTIHDTKHWTWSLRPHQATLGAGILSLKRGCSSFAELSQDEFMDLGKIIKVIEPTLKQCFDYDVINYFMLMMFDKHVHYHIFLRYENPVKILGETWKDNNWPAVPVLLGDAMPDERLHEIISFIKSRISLPLEDQ